MIEKLKKLAALLCAAAITLSLSACGGKTADEIKGHSAGKELKQTTAADDVFTLNYNSEYSMNPMVATNTSNQVVCNLVYENMVEVDNNFNVIPNVITSWTTEDGKLWTFTVAEDRYFHDGSKLTAEDVAYSLQSAANSDRYRGRLYYINGCSANDEKSFNVSLAKANMMFPVLLTIPVIKNGSFGNEFPQGSGPYALTRNHTKLQAYKKYYSYETLPLKTIYLAEYTTVDTVIAAFEDSLIDVVMNDPSAPTNLGYGAKNEIRSINTTNLHYIGFNMYSRIFSNDAMRNIVNIAIDREAVAKEQFGGYALATTQVISPDSDNYSDAVNKQNKYNLDKVGGVLKNLGLKDYDGDGILDMKTGDDEFVPVEINFVLCPSSSIKVNVARQFKNDMEKLGIKVNLSELSWSAYKKAIEKGNFDMYYGEVRLNSDFDPSRLVGSGGKLNYGGVSDLKLDEYIAAYLAANDEERFTAAENMSAYLANKAYIVPICFEKHQMITHRGLIDGIKVNENNPLYNFQNWKISFAEIIAGEADTEK